MDLNLKAYRELRQVVKTDFRNLVLVTQIVGKGIDFLPMDSEGHH